MDYFTYVILTVVICSIQAVAGFSIKRIDSTTRKGDGRKPKFFIPRKILGGSSVRHDEMLYVLSMDVRGSFRCGASAITSDWAISAAHCLDEKEPPDDVILWSDSKERMTGKRHRIEKYILHPKYESIVKNDVALLKVKDPFVIGKSLSLIQLIDADYKIKDDTDMIAAGWGLTKSGEDSDYLLKTTINYISNSKCNEIHRYYYFGFILTDGMLCGFSEGRDTTQGDSGGPLVLKTENGDILAGIVSYGSGEGKEDGPGIYTRVSVYVDWIKKVITGTVNTFDNSLEDDVRSPGDNNIFWRINNDGGDSTINNNNFYSGGGGEGSYLDFWRNNDNNDDNTIHWNDDGSNAYDGGVSNWNQFSNWDSNNDFLRDFLNNIQTI